MKFKDGWITDDRWMEVVYRNIQAISAWNRCSKPLWFCVFYFCIWYFFPLFLHMCILSAVCLDVLCWTSRLSEKGARSRASPVNRALWLGMADSCWPRPWTAAGSEFAALPWHVWNDPAVVYCAVFVWFMLSYGGPPVMCTLTAVHVCETRKAIFYMRSRVSLHLFFAVESGGN